MPKEILEAAKEGTLACFFGAGISTENCNVMPFTFYSSIKDEMKIERSITFSELMQKYCDMPNGRRKLLQRIRKRFNYINSFPEIKGRATRFHQELAELYFIKTIITTNWDTYFEECCNAIPITIPDDVALLDENDRYVLKIHGSISNMGTIIATKDDYQQCQERLEKGVVGAKLKTIFSNKTVVFFGFSFGDEDLSQILNYLEEEMKGVFPHLFIVTLDENLKERIEYKKNTIILTDGTFFLHSLKLILLEEKLIKNCHTRPIVSAMYELITDVHHRVSEISMQEYPCVIYCEVYQDGVLHAFSRCIALYNTGDYNIPGYILKIVKLYFDIIDQAEKDGNFCSAAYYKGYVCGLLFIDTCESEKELVQLLKIYYLPNEKEPIDTYDTFIAELQRTTEEQDEFFILAREIVSEVKDRDIVLHHPPFL
jgi:hypothetical protein